MNHNKIYDLKKRMVKNNLKISDNNNLSTWVPFRRKSGWNKKQKLRHFENGKIKKWVVKQKIK
jgi:hypothetical protein